MITKRHSEAVIGRGDFERPGACLPAGRRAVPAYAYPEDAARALGHAAVYSAWRNRQRGHVPDLAGLRTADARARIAEFLKAQPEGGWLPPDAVSDLLTCYQIPLVPTRRVTGEQEAVRAAADLGRPVVLKAEAEGWSTRPKPARSSSTCTANRRSARHTGNWWPHSGPI